MKSRIPLLGTKLKHSSEGTDSFEINHPVHRSFQISAYGAPDRSAWVEAIYNVTDRLLPVEECPSNRVAMTYLCENRPELVEDHWAFGIPELMKPALKGTLRKQGSGFPWSWQERLFVLKGCGLFYFKEDAHLPVGVVDMDGCQIIMEVGGEAPFKIRRPDGSEMSVRAGSEKLRAKWMESLNRATQRQKSGQDYDLVLEHWMNAIN